MDILNHSTVKASMTFLKGLYNLLKRSFQPSQRFIRIPRALGANSGHKGLCSLLNQGFYAHPEHWGVNKHTRITGASNTHTRITGASDKHTRITRASTSTPGSPGLQRALKISTPASSTETPKGRIRPNNLLKGSRLNQT
jgi:hypothetical protein